MNNVNQNIEEANKSNPILCQATPQVVFHPYVPYFLPNVLMDREEWPNLPASAKTTQASQLLTETAAPDTTTPASVGSGKEIQTVHDQRKVKPRHQE